VDAMQTGVVGDTNRKAVRGRLAPLAPTTSDGGRVAVNASLRRNQAGRVPMYG
jgi:hypothetical protein